MKLPLPTYRRPANITKLIEAISMFANQIDEAIKNLIAEPNMGLYNKNHLIQLIMFHAGLFMSEDNFKDIERYLGDGADALLRDYGVRS